MLSHMLFAIEMEAFREVRSRISGLLIYADDFASVFESFDSQKG